MTRQLIYHPSFWAIFLLDEKRTFLRSYFFFRYEDNFLVATFDSAPTVDSEIYRKLSAADRDEFEQKVSIH